MPQEVFKKIEPEFNKVIDHVGKEIAAIRTGRAQSSLIENIVVAAYGSRMKVRELAHISSPEPNQLLVHPWDQSIVKDIEKALVSTDLGLTPRIDGEKIRIVLPDLTQERREQLIKILHGKLEQSRITLRGLRDKARDEIQNLERTHKISEDEKYTALEELDLKTKEYVSEIDTLGNDKEREILGS